MQRLLLAAIFAAPFSCAQDMIAVSWSGGVDALDSFTGTSTSLHGFVRPEFAGSG
jgi:hypothetical protein